MKNPRMWFHLLSLVSICLLFAGDLAHPSPGPLSTVHAQEPELSQMNGCALCHGTDSLKPSDTCLECHETIADQVRLGRGLHGALAEDQVACGPCHGEHQGEDFEIVNARSFARCGFDDAEDFDHAFVGYDLSGRHLELGCAECHPRADDRVLPRGEQRFLGLDGACSGCHEDPHRGRMDRVCNECHGQVAFDELTAFVHDSRFPLVGYHEAPACGGCHPVEGDHSVTALASLGTLPKWRECLDCHESPHGGTFLEGVAQLVSLTVRGSCTGCHPLEGPVARGDGPDDVSFFRQPDLELSPEQHALTGFPLIEPHDQVSCDDCHPPELPFELRYPGRGPEECAACHEDPHVGQFSSHGPFDGVGCGTCHDRRGFAPHAFDVNDHRLTAFPLTGSHMPMDCLACHDQTLDEERRLFHGTPATCEECHEDPHRGEFDMLAASFEPLTSGSCSRCHDTTSFSDVPPESFDHEFWTGFELIGAHAQAVCESCHPRSSLTDDLGRTFGSPTEYFGSIESCDSCHDDPHWGLFDDPGMPQEVDGRRGCERCHVQVSFRQKLESGFDHAFWTGFALNGSHAQVACSGCHLPTTSPDELGRTFEPALGGDCADCHTEPHAGQFRVDGVTDCQRCHSNTEAFSQLSFDHQRDSRFPLDDAHAILSCSACHRPWQLESGAEAVRYKPLGTECVDCHGLNQNQSRDVDPGTDIDDRAPR